MTIFEAMSFSGIGYRLSRISLHRGSDGKGYIDIKYQYNRWQKGETPLVMVYIDVMANDWIVKELEYSKLYRLISGQ